MCMTLIDRTASPLVFVLCAFRRRIEGRFMAPLNRLYMSSDVSQFQPQVSLRTDPPDHARTRDLDQRTIACTDEFAVRATLAEIAHRAVIDDPGAAVRAEPDVGWTVEPAGAAH